MFRNEAEIAMIAPETDASVMAGFLAETLFEQVLERLPSKTDLHNHQVEKYNRLLAEATSTEAKAFLRAELHRLKKPSE